jgi:hypothetical protein
MATSAQIAANRANSKRSTGPRTDAGKQKSACNRLQHGFCSTSPLLPGDDPAAYDALLAELTAWFEPSGLDEQRLVREMADAEWRLRRVRVYQQRTVAFRAQALLQAHPELDPLHLQALAFEDSLRDAALAAYLRYEAQFQRQYDRARQALLASRRRSSPGVPRASDPALDAHAALESLLGEPIPRLPFEPKSPALPRLPALRKESAPPPKRSFAATVAGRRP